MDSSASHAVAKLKGILRKLFRVRATIFVTGSESGFPCEFALSKALSSPNDNGGHEDIIHSAADGKQAHSESQHLFASSQVCLTLDEALILAEDVLIASQNPEILKADPSHLESYERDNFGALTPTQEIDLGINFIASLCPSSDPIDITLLMSCMVREEYRKDDVLWLKGSESDCLKLIVRGTCISFPEETEKPEIIRCGNFIGELGLVNGTTRLSTVMCWSSSSVVFSLGRESWDLLRRQYPNVAEIVLNMVIKYLYHRLQHVKDFRNLPI